MRIPPRIARVSALSALSLTLLVGGPAAIAQATADAPKVSAPAASAPADVGKICETKLPEEAHETLDLIDKGGPYPYPQDGTVFENREGILPDQESGYYHEFTVKTPGENDRGARRIVTGKGDERYYTDDHYKSFRRIQADGGTDG